MIYSRLFTGLKIQLDKGKYIYIYIVKKQVLDSSNFFMCLYFYAFVVFFKIAFNNNFENNAKSVK